MSLVATVITISDRIGIAPLSGSTHASTSIARRAAVLWAQACRAVSADGMSSVGADGRISQAAHPVRRGSITANVAKLSDLLRHLSFSGDSAGRCCTMEPRGPSLD